MPRLWCSLSGRLPRTVNQVRLSVQLCTVYWHFLLALWLVLFTLLTPWVGDFADICRQLLP